MLSLTIYLPCCLPKVNIAAKVNAVERAGLIHSKSRMIHHVQPSLLSTSSGFNSLLIKDTIRLIHLYCGDLEPSMCRAYSSADSNRTVDSVIASL